MPTVGINDFVLRQTRESAFTHHHGIGGWKAVAALVLEHWERRRPGYRDGVCLVPVPPEGFFCGVVELEEGDELSGRYEARRPGEEPRKAVRAVGKGKGKMPAKSVEVVLYRRDVLEEGGEDCTGQDWDVISVNGSPAEGEMPIAPMTLIANHFELDGGTATGMNPEEFVEALRESVLFWRNKALLAEE
jgi:hypothetical protein